LVRWCRRNPWLAGADITAAALAVILVIGSAAATGIILDQQRQINHMALARLAATQARRALPPPPAAARGDAQRSGISCTVGSASHSSAVADCVEKKKRN
jgi:hypothetical protein